MCDFTKYGIPSKEWLEVQATLPSPAQDQSIEEVKMATNRQREAVAEIEMKNLADQVSMQDFSITARDGYELEGRAYRLAATPGDEILPVYLHFHGGGYLFGTLSSEDAICSRIAINTGVVVFNVNYRHTPEYTYPVAWNDAEDSFMWICSNSTKIRGNLNKVVVGGISAGGCLSAALSRTVLNSELNVSPAPKILGQVLMIPSLVWAGCYESQSNQMKDGSVSSYQQAADAPFLNKERIKLFNDLLKVQNPDPKDKRLNPGHLTPKEAQSMPPTTLGIAGYDPLRDEGILYGKLLSENECV